MAANVSVVFVSTERKLEPRKEGEGDNVRICAPNERVPNMMEPFVNG